jgi:hypothetical protein
MVATAHVVPRSARAVTFVALLLGTLAMGSALGTHGAVLKRDDVCGVAALELAPTRGRAEHVVGVWSTNGLAGVALEDIRFDYAFIALYSTTLALAGFLGALVLPGLFGRIGAKIGWLMWLAGFCDVLENLGMTRELAGTFGVAPFVCAVSALKWLLLAVGLPYGIAALVAAVVRIRLVWSALGEA